MTGKQVVRIRKLLGLDQGRFARVFCVSRATINVYEQHLDEEIAKGSTVAAFAAVEHALKSASGAQISFTQESLRRNLDRPSSKDHELLWRTLEMLRSN